MRAVFLSIITAAAIVSPATALATRNVQADVGHNVWNYANESCMRSTWTTGGIQNNCTGTELWEVALPIESIGWKTVNVEVYAGDNAISCITMTFDKDGNFYQQSGWVSSRSSLGIWPTNNSIALNATYPPPSGTGYAMVQCSIQPPSIYGASIMRSLTYTP